MKKFQKLVVFFLLAISFHHVRAQEPADCVNPFIGTTNFGTCNPGAICPTGMMSVVPFNVMGSDLNRYDKDKRWWSTPYDNTNSFFTGYSHVNLSGVGCPEMGSLLVMPTTGELNLDYHDYGSTYTDERALPGYYSNRLTKYGILTEVTATPRTSRLRFTFPKGESHIILNLGEGLTNESGATIRRVSENEFEGSKLLGTFCYCSQAVFPIYFVMKIVNVQPEETAVWKKQRPMQAEAEWDADQGRHKIYKGYGKELSGDDVGGVVTFQTIENQQVEVQLGVSFVSIEGARKNLAQEQPASAHFDGLRQSAWQQWNESLKKVEVEGGTADERTVFYTALYHLQIHPNVLNDVDGKYPMLERNDIGMVNGRDRYTVFSLWDTYRCTHQLQTLLYPKRQLDMVNSMLDMYRESGWLPKWELFGRETFTMEGDPAIPVIVDTWQKGLRDFDINLAYEAMKKGATTPQKDNLLRPDVDDYFEKGYCPLMEQYDNSVSHALEYYAADFALAQLAEELGNKDDAKLFGERAKGYRHYYSPEYGTLRPILPNGQFLTPFDPKQGENFEPSPGFHEGNAWNYTFAIPFDVKGLAKLMGGDKKFVQNLQNVFDSGNYDPANEPDIVYPFLFSRFKGEEWRTQELTRKLLRENFKNAPDGIPGNDDTGTMSAWAVFAMMGIYPDCPGEPYYTVTAPVFDKVTIHLDKKYHGTDKLVISAPGAGKNTRIKSLEMGGKKLKAYRVKHQDLLRSGELKINF